MRQWSGSTLGVLRRSRFTRARSGVPVDLHDDHAIEWRVRLCQRPHVDGDRCGAHHQQLFARLYPWGSHPLCDPLLSASELRMVHYGAAFDRIERTASIARDDSALELLHVCGRNGHGKGNCGNCRKCLRTMCTLDLLGARSRAKSFPWCHYTPRRLSRVLLPDVNEQSFFVYIADRARSSGRDDLLTFARSSLAYSNSRTAGNLLRRAAWKAIYLARRARLHRLGTAIQEDAEARPEL